MAPLGATSQLQALLHLLLAKLRPPIAVGSVFTPLPWMGLQSLTLPQSEFALPFLTMEVNQSHHHAQSIYKMQVALIMGLMSSV